MQATHLVKGLLASRAVVAAIIVVGVMASAVACATDSDEAEPRVGGATTIAIASDAAYCGVLLRSQGELADSLDHANGSIAKTGSAADVIDAVDGYLAAEHRYFLQIADGAPEALRADIAAGRDETSSADGPNPVVLDEVRRRIDGWTAANCSADR